MVEPGTLPEHFPFLPCIVEHSSPAGRVSLDGVKADLALMTTVSEPWLGQAA